MTRQEIIDELNKEVPRYVGFRVCCGISEIRVGEIPMWACIYTVLISKN